MLLKLTLQRVGIADGDDVLVDADPTTPIGRLAMAIGERDPRRSGALPPGDVTLRVEGPGTPRTIDAEQILSEASLRSGDRVTLQAVGGRYQDGSAERSSAATLVVREGPQTGERFDLRRGSNQAGREAGSDVRLLDPMVSKRHARFNVTDVVEVLDLGSINGVFVGTEQVERAILRPGDVVLLGDTLLAVEQIRTSSTAASAGPVVSFNRSPYLDPIYEGETLKAPDPPTPPGPTRFPSIALVAPLLFGVIMYAFTRQLISVIFMALSPVMMIGAFVEGKRSSKQAMREATETYRSALKYLGSALTRAQGEEVARRRLEQPPSRQVASAGANLAPMLWTRRPDRHGFLDLRLGLASLPTRTSIELPTSNNTLPELWEELMEVVDRHALVPDVPVVAKLTEEGVLGIAGATDDALGAARGLVTQVAGLHSPAEVAIAALLSNQSAPHWDWLKWLPHTTTEHAPVETQLLASGAHGASALVASLRDLIDHRLEDRRATDEGPAPVPAIVVIVDDGVPVERSLLIELVERGRHAGVYFIWVAATVEALPAAATVFLAHDPSTHQALAGFIDGGRSVTPVSSEPLSGADVLEFARALAPVVDAGARHDEAGDLPSRVSFLDEAGLDLAHSSDAVVDRWRLSDSLPITDAGQVTRRKRDLPLHAIVGVGAQGPLQLDLRSQGPHALVGGTTGAGKSEFLQSWIMGLATTHSPARVTFLFVDYKGGAAFSECVRLPHTVGLVTDLTPHLVNRALASLNAELKFREHILNRKKVKDVLEMEKKRDPETPPSLVIVVDEFAALVAEVPEFVDGVVNVAQRGRSLGLHLILATQRPAGVIRDNLRANTNLRVALRMADEGDSDDVVGSDVAAGFDPALPGRAVAKLGPGRLSPFQAAYVGGWTTGEPPEPRIVLSSFAAGTVQEWAEVDADDGVDLTADELGPNDLERLVDTIKDASTQAAIVLPRKPWLPELEPTYDLGRPPADQDDFRLISRTDEHLIFGVLDDPASQAQAPVAFEPDRDGNMVVVGTGGSGKSAFLRTLAVAGALSTRGGPCHVYGLDFASRGLDMLEELPNVGSVVNGDDPERVARLLQSLSDLIDERQVRYARTRSDTISHYRAAAERPDEARIVLLVDGYPTFRQEYEVSSRMRVYELFQSIATNGRQAGVHVVVAADRIGAIPSALSSVIQKRLVLRLAGDSEYALASVPADAFPTGTPPGRGFFNDREVQVAVLGGDPNTATQAEAISRLAAVAASRGVAPAPPVGSLPEQVRLADLPVLDGTDPVIGVADDTLGPCGVVLDAPLLVAGPPRSGKATTIQSIITAVGRTREVVDLVYIGEGRSWIARKDQWTHEVVAGPEVGDLLSKVEAALGVGSVPAVGAHASTVVFIEDAAKVGGWGDADRIGVLVQHVVDGGGVVLAEGETSTLSGTYGLMQVLKASRTGIVLVPDQYDGESLFKTPFPKLSRVDFPPGRGLYVRGGRARKVQVALVEGDET